MSEKFGEVSIIEHFNTFYRLKAPADVSVGKMFGFLEENVKFVKFDVRLSSILYKLQFNMFVFIIAGGGNA